MNDAPTSSDSRKGRYWPIAIALFLGGWVVADIFMLVKATRDPSFAVEEDYYQKAVDWDEFAAQRATNSQLGWRAVLTATVLGSSETRLNVVLVDDTGTAIEGATVTLKAFHIARSGDIFQSTLPALEDGSYGATLPLRRAGLWDFRLHISHGDETYTQTIRHELGRRSRS